jgi:dTDP-4-dehydrorhamnose reductase
MKTLVIGSKGQLGVALAETCPENVQIIGVDLPELDITDAVAVEDICRRENPSIIVNAAAYTAVDKAESEPDLAAAVNVAGPGNIAAAAAKVGARLIHISTDFVFDGESTTPYAPDAATSPLGVYGRTKREGELALLAELPGSVVVRTAWLYSKTGGNFVKTMLRLMAERDEIGVVADQVGTPTWANSLAEIVWGFAESADTAGVFHWTDGGSATWHDFAVAIQDQAFELGLLGRKIPINSIKTEDYPTPARRPGFSVLDCSATIAALGVEPTPWRANLRAMLKDMSA